jgi:hypothetical protein
MPVPAAHEEMEYDPQLDHRYVGYILHMNGIKLYRRILTVEILSVKTSRKEAAN